MNCFLSCTFCLSRGGLPHHNDGLSRLGSRRFAEESPGSKG